MATTLKQVVGAAAVTLASTELSSLANNTNVISSVGGTSGAFNNVSGGTTNLDGYVRGEFELNLASLTVTAGGSVKVWFITEIDGTNYEDGASTTPARNPDIIFPLNSGTGAQRVIRRARLPAGQWKVLVRNDAIGASLGASGNTLKVLSETDSAV